MAEFAKEKTIACIAAAKEGNLDKVRSLVTAGIWVAGYNKKEQALDANPLLAAAEAGHLNIVEYLISTHKFKLDARNTKGMTALMLAAKGGHIDVVRALLQAGAKINQRKHEMTWDKWVEYTPREVSAFLEHMVGTEYLYVPSGRYVTQPYFAQDIEWRLEGYTALMFAINAKQKETANLLLGKLNATHQTLSKYELNQLHYNGHKDFSNLNLKGVRLSDLTLKNCDFGGAILDGANVKGTQFNACTFEGASFLEIKTNPHTKFNAETKFGNAPSSYVGFFNKADPKDTLKRVLEDYTQFLAWNAWFALFIRGHWNRSYVNQVTELLKKWNASDLSDDKKTAQGIYNEVLGQGEVALGHNPNGSFARRLKFVAKQEGTALQLKTPILV